MRTRRQSVTLPPPRPPGHSPGPRVRDIMTPEPHACLPGDTAEHAARLMKTLDTGIMPVIDDAQARRLVGVVTDRDLCLAVIAQGRKPQTLVSDCMTSTPVTCDPDDRVERTLELMEVWRIRRIMVVDEEQYLQGVVSLADVVRRVTLPGQRTHALLERICEPTKRASVSRAIAHGGTGTIIN